MARPQGTVSPARFSFARHAAIAPRAYLLAVFNVRTTLHVTASASTVLKTLAGVADHVFAVARCAYLFTVLNVLRALQMAAMSRRALLYALVFDVTVERTFLAVAVLRVAQLSTV